MQVPRAQAQYSTFSIRPDRKPPWTVGRDTGRIYLSRATAPMKWNWQMGDPAGPENNHACVAILITSMKMRMMNHLYMYIILVSGRITYIIIEITDLIRLNKYTKTKWTDSFSIQGKKASLKNKSTKQVMQNHRYPPRKIQVRFRDTGPKQEAHDVYVSTKYNKGVHFYTPTASKALWLYT